MKPAHKPKLGQNFLVDAAAARSIVDALGDISRQTVIEIGPGKGAITEMLAERAKRLIAVELDAVMAPALKERFAQNAAVEVIQADILEVDLPGLLVADETVRVIGNLPYYITSDILLYLFANQASIDRAVVMMQREVADRVAADPGSRDYGLLSATTQLHARVEKLFTLPPRAFSPPPEVYSTVLRLTMHPHWQDLGVDREPFVIFLKQIFAQKRKTIVNNLRHAGHATAAIAAALERAGIAPQQRAEALTLEESAQLFKSLALPQ